MLTKIKKKYEYVLDAFLSVCQADRPKRGRQWLELDVDKQSYTDGKKIHVGMKTIEFKTDLKELYEELDEEFETVILSQYLLEHEDQHNRSTRDKDWVAAQDRAYYRVLEEISKLRKDNFVFKNISDYDNYIKELSDNGYSLNSNRVKEICHGIVNSIEDGRIERIRSVKRPGFGQRMVYVRGRLWYEDTTIERIEDITNLKAPEKFALLMNNILELATTRVYIKDFFDNFQGTDIFNDVNKLRPFIKSGIMAGKCRGIVRPSEEIAKILTPYIMEIALSEKDMQESMNNLANKMADNGMAEDKSQYPAKSFNEETTEDNEDAGNPMGQSDLDDDSDSSESSNKADGQNGESSESEVDANADTDTENGVGNQGSGDQEAGTEENEQGTSDGSDGDSTESDSGSGKEAKEGESGKGEAIDNSNPSDGKLDDSFDLGHRGHSSGNSNISDADSLKAVVEAMKAAAENMQGDFQAMKRQSTKNANKNIDNKTQEDIPPFVPKDPKLARNFKELKRAYKVDDMMPFALQNRSDKFKEDVEELFANQEIPLVRCQKNGKIDSSNIYKLGVNTIDCFSKEMDSPEFDGAAYILVDNSGSMGYGYGSNRFHACNSVSVVEAGFSAHMPLKIVAFDDYGEIYHEIIKDWDEELGCSGAYNFLKKGRKGGGTPTGESILIATEELIAKGCESKILIIMTDGEPNDASLCRSAIENAINSGIEVVTIFFDEIASYIQELKEDGNLEKAAMYEERLKESSKARKTIFGRNSIFCSPEESEKELVSIMETFVFG